MIGVPTIKLLCRFEAKTPNPFHAQGDAAVDEVQDSSPYVVSDSRICEVYGLANDVISRDESATRMEKSPDSLPHRRMIRVLAID
jgi:hypothetical protein